MKLGEPKLIVAANLRDDAPGLLTQTDGVIAGIEAHPAFFPNAGPILQVLKDARKTMGETHTATSPLKRGRKARSPAERALRNKLLDAARFVETCANEDLANGPAIVAASTFSLKARSTYTKPPLKLKNGKASSTVVADAKAAKKVRSFYWWRYSLDNGQSWLEVEGTNTCKTLLEGLPVHKIVLVQVALTQSNVRSPWSDSASILVL
jgi:hypothetical protein